MLSKDEVATGKVFVIRLWGEDGRPMQWLETLRGPLAERWYWIYRFSNWPALRAEGPGVFRRSVSVEEFERAVETGECVYIHTDEVKAEEMRGGI